MKNIQFSQNELSKLPVFTYCTIVKYIEHYEQSPWGRVVLCRQFPPAYNLQMFSDNVQNSTNSTMFRDVGPRREPRPNYLN